MSNKIIDTASVKEAISGGPSATETVTLITPPQRIGTIARISFQLHLDGGDTAWSIRRGAGLDGAILFGPGGAVATTLLVDESPASQYTLTATGDGSETDTGTAVIYIDQIS